MSRAARYASGLVLAALFGAGAVACFQELDTGAALDPPSAVDGGPTDDGATTLTSTTVGDASTWELCGSPACDDPSGSVPFLAEAPVVFLPDGTTTSDPCVQVLAASMAIRTKYCASCHGPSTGAGQGGFAYVLDDAKLVADTSSNATFPHLVAPGSPYQSYLYVRTANATMPPPSIPGAPPNPMPTAANLSVLYGWIVQCVPGADAGYVTGGGNYGPGVGGAMDAGTDATADAAGK